MHQICSEILVNFTNFAQKLLKDYKPHASIKFCMKNATNVVLKYYETIAV